MTSPVFHAKTDDPAMREAMARAVDSFKYLWRELTWEYRRIVPALELSAIKAAFKDPDDADSDRVEHMWLSDIEFDGDVIRATLMNEPNWLESVKQGDPVSLRKEELEDWMYVSEGRAYGGFTIQAIRAKMSAAERREHDEAWGFDFGDPSRVDVVPNWDEKKAPGAAGDPEAEHPMSENMAAGLADALKKNRDAFFELGPAGLNTLHSLALGGSAACVRGLLAAGGDPRMKTRSGKTARDLADAMGWPRVVKLLADAGG